MASKGRGPPPHRRPIPGPGMVHPDPYASAIQPPPGGFPPFERLPPHEVMEHKLSAQHIEIEKLLMENRRLAATHGSLRQDLATAKHELQLINTHIADMKSEKEQEMRSIMDKMSMREAELESAERIKMELKQARAEAESLVANRKELFSKVQQLTRDLQKAHSEAQQIPSLMSELDSLRQEYQHCRATYDYEKKLYNDHLESLQVMEKNYMAMSREVEKLRAELTNYSNFDPRTGGPYGAIAGYNPSIPAANYASGQNAHGVALGQNPHPGAGAGAPTRPGANSPHVIAQSVGPGPGTTHDAASRVGYDPQRAPVGAGFESQRITAGPSYGAHTGPPGPPSDAHRGPTGPGYDAHRGRTGPGAAPAYEARRGYDAHKGYAYDGQRAPPSYDMQRVSGDVASSKGTTSVGPPQGHQVSMNNVPYPSVPPQGGNPV